MTSPDPLDAEASLLAPLICTSWFYRALFLLLMLGGVVSGVEMAVLSHKRAIIAATVVMTAVWIAAVFYAIFNTWREWRLVRWLERKR